MSRRFWFITVSILAHVGFGIAVFASGVWHIDRLDPDRRAISVVAALGPPPSAAGGSPQLPEVKLQPKDKPKVITKDLTQLVKLPEPDAKPAIVTGRTGDGSGSGSNVGSGSDGDIGTCVVGCGSGSDTEKPVIAKQDPPKPEGPITIPPNVLTMMRTSGSTQIHPPEVTKTAMLRDGRDRSVGIVKVCVSETGAVSDVSMITSTKYAAFDERLISGIKGWTYRPYAAKGRNVKVCGTVTFIYSIK